jgi:poly-gamma-glutamate capsule biosynthesis protein CapA/YwtB (metallophosphatase superfamily)
MTKWWWLLDSGNCWESRLIVVSEAIPGVSFAIARMTFGRRLELMKRVRDLAARIEYFDAGRDEKNRMEASLLGAEMDKVYLAWGLEEVRGLVLDGEAATAAALVERGPEALVHEALAAIKAECGLTETERKN